MNTLTMDYLENNFNVAASMESKFVGLRIRMDGFPEDEIIINPRANFESKLKYYKKTYGSENLNHKYSQGIRIVGFTYGDDFMDIQEDLLD